MYLQPLPVSGMDSRVNISLPAPRKHTESDRQIPVNSRTPRSAAVSIGPVFHGVFPQQGKRLTISPNKRRNSKIVLINTDHVNKFVAGITDRRVKALVLLMLDSGLHPGEIVKLDRDSITDGSVRILSAGQLGCTSSPKDRTISLSARAMTAITEYFAEDRAVHGVRYLFATDNGRLDVAAIRCMMHRWCDLIEIERIGPRQLRRYFASSFVTSGGSPTALYRLLGLKIPNWLS